MSCAPGLRRGTWLLVAALALVALPATAQEPIARVSLRDQGPVMVSAGARLAVAVLVPTFFRGPVTFPDEIELPDAIVLLAPGASQNLTERIDGASWSGIQRTYRVYPTRPGTIRVDPIELTVVYALENSQPSPATPVQTEPLEFEAFVPDEARGLSQFFASSAFELTTDMRPETTSALVGESITRTFTMTAENTPGLFLPRMDFPSIDGVGVYAGQPSLAETGGQRGSARTAERRESVTYTFEEPGTYTLPGIAVNWWDADAESLRTATAPEIAITVEANTDLDAAMLETDEIVPEPEPAGRAWVRLLRDHWRQLVAATVALLLGIKLVLPLSRRAASWLQQRRADRAESEGRYFRDFVHVARTGSAGAVYSALARWLDRWAPPGITFTATDFAAQYGSKELGTEIAALTAAAYGGGADRWSRHALVRGVENARRRDHARRRSAPALPPLNPTD